MRAMPTLGYNYTNVPVRKTQRRRVRHPPRPQFLQQRFHLCALQLRSGRVVRSRRFAGIRRARRFCQHAEHHQPRTQRGGFGNPHFFRQNHQPVQRGIQSDFQSHFVLRHRHLRSREAWHSRRRSGKPCDSITGYPASLNQSTKDCVGCGLSSTQLTGYWSVGDRGFSPFQGGTNVFSVSDSLDMIRGKHDIRDRRRDSRQPDERADQWLRRRLFPGVWQLHRRRYGRLASRSDRWRHSRSDLLWARRPAVAGRCFVPSCRTTGESPTT